MSKNIRIIPVLHVKGQNVVKPVHTEALKVVGAPKTFAHRYYREGADELIYLDIVASLYRRNLDFDLLASVVADVFIPVTVGGGIRSLADINNALRSGADKVAINTFAVHHPEFLREAANQFGSQCVTLSIEAKKHGNGSYEAYTDGGREATGVDAIDWAKRAIELGVGEILVTSIDRDGTRKGYDLSLVRALASLSPVPVIAHGGAGTLDSIADAVRKGQADAVGMSSIFHYEEQGIRGVKEYLRGNSIDVRL